MKKFIFIFAGLAVVISVILFFASKNNSNADIKITLSSSDIKLPPPEETGGMPLMEALSKRHSSRNISQTKLSEQVLSNLLWAAFGINRPESGKRTAPTANDSRAMDVFVALESGTYRYDAAEHSLVLIVNKDLRALTGKQDFVNNAPVNLIYIADYSKLKSGSEKEIYSGAHAGFIGQNVYLYCTSAGLGTVVRAWVDKDKLAKELNLKSEQNIILAQTVGYEE